MDLSTAQKAVFKADILAKQASGQPLEGANEDIVAAYYNAASSTSVWRTDAPVQDIYDAIDWAKYTPADAPEATGIFTARALAIQTKQMNLQNMLIGRDTINAAKPNVRAGLRDAVIGLPSGASGAAVSAGGTGGSAVLAACIRLANRLEALLCATSAGSDTTGPTTARVMAYEGTVTNQQVSDILAG